MRSYTVAITALAIGAPKKWTDNVISQFVVPEVLSEQRGVSRRVSHSGVIRLCLVRELHSRFGVSVSVALTMADEFFKAPNDPVLRIGHLALSFDRAAMEHDVNARLADALESAPVPKRGRPPQRSRT